MVGICAFLARIPTIPALHQALGVVGLTTPNVDLRRVGHSQP